MTDELCGEPMGEFGFHGTDAHPERTCDLPKGHGGFTHESHFPKWCWWPRRQDFGPSERFGPFTIMESKP